jgi:hypothetical protein
VNPNDQYMMSQVSPMLGAGEQVMFTATMRRQPGLLMQLLLVGGLLLFLLTKIYFVALTNRRMILIRSKMGFFSLSGAPKHMNLGVEEWDVRSIQKVTTSGFANNRSMTFHLADRGKQTLRIAPWMKTITGTKDFFEQVPNLVASGQLAQLGGGGAPPAQLGQGGYQQQHGGHHQQHQQQHGGHQQQHAGYGAQPPAAFTAQPQAAYGSPQQHGGYTGQPQPAYGAPPPHHAPQAAVGFAPGTQVVVTAQDGSRHYATIVGEQQGHYLCNTQSGQHWFPAQHVAHA